MELQWSYNFRVTKLQIGSLQNLCVEKYLCGRSRRD